MSTSVSTTGSSRGGRKSRRAVVIVCSILCTLLVAALVLIKGNVSGTEFAPSHFQTREFSFYEIPFLHLQITPVRRKMVTDATSRQIRTSAWIQVPRGKPPETWHLVSLSRGPTTTPALGQLLTDELTVRDSSGPFWSSWNSDHPKRAAVLWPVVQRLAERELYLLIPELMQLGRTHADDATLPKAIDQWLIDQYVGLIRDMREADRTDLADALLREAVQDYPDSDALAALQS
ncbi:hypothetical protein FYK55_26570 [Roseiconus nitratireducens]|uniref:Uncharacterized protein n=1 Tax=Roseiconus nitratireducens TaxID=2605748 RepID=A0A5M6CUY9_9BACT|nr:hypothetical protein [Roseiconus nitratireducens]KAA5538766.1 hypothetical protein FYK55_26570 [Roseiconus nitratireducens]